MSPPKMQSSPLYGGRPIDFLLKYGGRTFDFSRLVLIKSEDFKTNYSISSSHFRYTELETTAADSIFLNYSDFYAPTISKALLAINNRFRYGSLPKERFSSIVFRGDPWRDKNASIQFIRADESVKSRMMSQFEFYCKFTCYTELHQKLYYTLVRGTVSSAYHASCGIPGKGFSYLKGQRGPTHLIFDFVGKGNKTLISQIKMRRPDSLDVRTFNVSVVAFCDNLEDPMVYEWIIYYSLLGIDHFYIFDNSKGVSNLLTSQLRPFVDANILTVIYYPLVPLKGQHWNTIQVSSFNYFLQKYGSYNRYVGFIDVDEFFLPSRRYYPKQKISNSIILRLLEKKMAGKRTCKVPAVNANSTEMGCRAEIGWYNHYHGGTSAAPKYRRFAVSVHCNKRGDDFDERKTGHGKFFFKPACAGYAPYMHHYIGNSEGNSLWMDDEDGGRFMHFSGNFRYSSSRHPSFSVDALVTDATLRNFTLLMLQLYGIKNVSI